MTTRRGLRPLLPRTCAFLLAAALVPGLGRAGEAWVDYTDETATRLVADPAVGVNDNKEKDYISGDVDKDGDTDLVVVRKQPFTTPGPERGVLFMNEDGVLVDRSATLAPDLLTPRNERDVELVDVDGDGWLDIVTAGTFQFQPRILMNLGEVGGNWQGFEWDPDRFPFLESEQGFGPFFCGIGVGDVTGDGRPDIYFADYGGRQVGEGNDLNDRLLVNDPTNPGFFLDETAIRLQSDMVQSCFGTDADIGDVNGDGFLDVVKSTGVGSDPPGAFPCPTVLVLYNDGTGHFDFMDTVYAQAPYHVEPADFTEDGRLDLFVVDDGQDSYLINTGNDLQGHAEFDQHLVQTSPDTSGFGGNVKFADLDLDGVLDVVVADVDVDINDCGGEEVALLRGEGTPPDISYRDPFSGNTPWVGYSSFDAEPMHIDDDPVLDLVIGACTGTRVFMGFAPAFIFGDDFEAGDTSAWDEISN